MEPILIYILIGVFTPGPNNIMSSSTSSKIGVLKTLPFMLGVLVGTFIVFYLTGMFNVLLFDNVEVVKKYVGYIGAVYMTYLAFKIATSDTLEKPDNSENSKDFLETNLFPKGILLTFVNPKAIVFGLTVTGLLLHIGLADEALIGVAFFLAILCFVSVLVWGFLGQLFMNVLSQYLKIFNLVMATLLIFSALAIIIDTL